MFVLISVHAGKSTSGLLHNAHSTNNKRINSVLNLWRTYIGFVYHISAPKGPLTFVATLKTWHQILKDILYVTVSLIGDGIAV
jgi:hypothetical protein